MLIQNDTSLLFLGKEFQWRRIDNENVVLLDGGTWIREDSLSASHNQVSTFTLKISSRIWHFLHDDDVSIKRWSNIVIRQSYLSYLPRRWDNRQMLYRLHSANRSFQTLGCEKPRCSNSTEVFRRHMKEDMVTVCIAFPLFSLLTCRCLLENVDIYLFLLLSVRLIVSLRRDKRPPTLGYVNRNDKNQW